MPAPRTLAAVLLAGLSQSFRLAPPRATRSVSMTAMAPSDADAFAPPPRAPRSALVLGWFGASPRELSLVERLYKRNGYDDVTVLPSRVGSLTKPSGWFRTFRQHVAQASSGAAHPVGRHFDVVHAMSGGFLQLYLLRAARVGLSFDKLLLDSTPILPKPAAFANFQREFVASELRGASLLAAPLRVLALLPARAHAALVHASWVVGAARARAGQKARSLLARCPHGDSGAGAGAGGSARRQRHMRQWVRLATGAAFSNRFGRLVEHATKTALAPGLGGVAKEIIFLFNPADPYISQGDLQDTIIATRANCARSGCEVRSVLTNQKHVHTIMREPRAIFRALEDPVA